MKDDFYIALRNSKRKVVVHHCHLLKDIISLLDDNDLVFFDDCLYSQYVFFKQNAEKLESKNIKIVLGFSTSLHRDPTHVGIYDVCSAVLHDKVHAGDIAALDGFMTLDEIKEMLSYSNVYLACHGNMHLQLQSLCKTNVQYAKEFSTDLATAVKKLEEFGLSTDIFVYPYAFDFFISDKIVKQHGFKHVFAGRNSRRTEIEQLA